MSSDRHHSDVHRHHTFCVTIYWGCCALCWLYPVGYPRIHFLLSQICDTGLGAYIHMYSVTVQYVVAGTDVSREKTVQLAKGTPKDSKEGGPGANPFK